MRFFVYLHTANFTTIEFICKRFMAYKILLNSLGFVIYTMSLYCIAKCSQYIIFCKYIVGVPFLRLFVCKFCDFSRESCCPEMNRKISDCGTNPKNCLVRVASLLESNEQLANLLFAWKCGKSVCGYIVGNRASCILKIKSNSFRQLKYLHLENESEKERDRKCMCLSTGMILKWKTQNNWPMSSKFLSIADLPIYLSIVMIVSVNTLCSARTMYLYLITHLIGLNCVYLDSNHLSNHKRTIIV